MELSWPALLLIAATCARKLSPPGFCRNSQRLVLKTHGMALPQLGKLAKTLREVLLTGFAAISSDLRVKILPHGSCCNLQRLVLMCCSFSATRCNLCVKRLLHSFCCKSPRLVRETNGTALLRLAKPLCETLSALLCCKLQRLVRKTLTTRLLQSFAATCA